MEMHPRTRDYPESSLDRMIEDESELTGRWFWGTYQEFGMDVTMQRATSGTSVLGVDVGALKAGSADNTVRIFGSQLPSSLGNADIDLGPGVAVTEVVSLATPFEIVTVPNMLLPS